MLNRIFKQSVFLFLIAVMFVTFFGCGKNENVEDGLERVGVVKDGFSNNEIVERREVVGLVKNEVIEKNDKDFILDDLKHEPYVFGNISFKYPQNWYFIKEVMPGGGFISNKKYLDLREYNNIKDDEVRVYIGIVPDNDHDSSYYKETSMSEALKYFSDQEKREVEQECQDVKVENDESFKYQYSCKKVRNACYDSGIKEENGIKYIVTTCEYSENDNVSNKEKYILKREIAYEKKIEDEVYVERISIVMFSYNKDLLNQKDLNLMFEGLKESVLYQ